MQVITDLNADQQAVRKILLKYGLFALAPVEVTRMEERNGLLCHRDPEFAWVCPGNDIPEGLRDEDLIADVLESPEVRCC